MPQRIVTSLWITMLLIANGSVLLTRVSTATIKKEKINFQESDQNFEKRSNDNRNKKNLSREQPDVIFDKVLTNFEGDNSNEMIPFSRERKAALDILKIGPFTKKEFINQENLHLTPYKNLINEKNPSLKILRRFQKWQNHLYRISKRSLQAYDEFANKVLKINSPNFYQNSQEILHDFKETHLRDNVHVQLELERVFQLVGKESYNIVNMYNYLINFYGKENVKRWLFTLFVKDKFQSLKSSILGFVGGPVMFDYQFLGLATRAFNQNLISRNYNTAYSSSNNITKTFIHEYGHVLDRALKFRPKQMNLNFLPTKQFVKANQKILKTTHPELEQWQIKNPTANDSKSNYGNFSQKKIIINPRSDFFDFIGEKIGYQKKDIKIIFAANEYLLGINEASINTFALAKMFVDGKYGRTTMGETFAELFAYWMLKPAMQSDRSKYSIRWTILNEFFLDYLPTTYQKALRAKW